MRRKSRYVCKRDGLAVHIWGSRTGKTFWKHSTGGGGKLSCGKAPQVVERPEEPQ